MKKVYSLLVLLFLVVFRCEASYTSEGERLLLNDVNSVILKFSSEIKYVDFGVGEIMGEKLSSGYMLKLKSSKAGFDESTISIVTADGGYHQFPVSYSDTISEYVWQESGNSHTIDSIGISSAKTTHFICDERITDIVLGSEDVIADYAEKIDNIVKAKVLNLNFTSSNIQLVTQSGYIYTFIVKPDVSPLRSSVFLSQEEDVTQLSQAIFKSNSVNEKQMKDFASELMQSKPTINDIGFVGQKMACALSGIYSFNDLLVFKFDIWNRGHIDYLIDFFKGYIRDKSTSKTTAMQEEEIYPVFLQYSKESDPGVIKSGESETIVVFYSRFTLPRKRILYFEFFEHNGGRHISFSVTSKEILRAKSVH